MAAFESRLLFLLLVALVGIQRIGEFWLSKRNERRLRARGGIEQSHGQVRWMVAIHLLFPFVMLAEVYLLGRPLIPGLAGAMLLILCLAQGVRLWVVATLGDRWTVKIMVVPGEDAKQGGPYRFLRHPNYTAVVFEMAALPLLHSAWLTAGLFSALNGCFLRRRILAEEQALRQAGTYFAEPERSDHA